MIDAYCRLHERRKWSQNEAEPAPDLKQPIRLLWAKLADDICDGIVDSVGKDRQSPGNHDRGELVRGLAEGGECISHYRRFQFCRKRHFPSKNAAAHTLFCVAVKPFCRARPMKNEAPILDLS